MAVVEALLWLAAACGVAGAASGNRTAWALLASVVLCLVLDWRGVEFNAFFWWLIDVLVIAVFARRGMPRTDWVVMALFPFAWAAYLLPDPWRYQVSLAVVSAQLVAMFPAHRVWRALKQVTSDMSRKDDFDLMVSA